MCPTYKRIDRINVVPDREERIAEIALNPAGMPLRTCSSAPWWARATTRWSTTCTPRPTGARCTSSRPSFGDVVAIDLATRKIVWRTPLRTGVRRADHMAISPDGTAARRVEPRRGRARRSSRCWTRRPARSWASSRPATRRTRTTSPATASGSSTPASGASTRPADEPGARRDQGQPRLRDRRRRDAEGHQADQHGRQARRVRPARDERGGAADGAVARREEGSTSRSPSSTGSWSTTSRPTRSRASPTCRSRPSRPQLRRDAVHPRLRPPRDRDERRRDEALRRGHDVQLRGDRATRRLLAPHPPARRAHVLVDHERRRQVLLRVGRRRRHDVDHLLRHRAGGRPRAGRRPPAARAHGGGRDVDLRRAGRRQGAAAVPLAEREAGTRPPRALPLPTLRPPRPARGDRRGNRVPGPGDRGHPPWQPGRRARRDAPARERDALRLRPHARGVAPRGARRCAPAASPPARASGATTRCCRCARGACGCACGRRRRSWRQRSCLRPHRGEDRSEAATDPDLGRYATQKPISSEHRRSD